MKKQILLYSSLVLILSSIGMIIISGLNLITFMVGVSLNGLAMLLLWVRQHTCSVCGGKLILKEKNVLDVKEYVRRGRYDVRYTYKKVYVCKKCQHIDYKTVQK